jgi:hypothetical protein
MRHKSSKKVNAVALPFVWAWLDFFREKLFTTKRPMA